MEQGTKCPPSYQSFSHGLAVFIHFPNIEQQRVDSFWCAFEKGTMSLFLSKLSARTMGETNRLQKSRLMTYAKGSSFGYRRTLNWRHWMIYSRYEVAVWWRKSESVWPNMNMATLSLLRSNDTRIKPPPGDLKFSLLFFDVWCSFLWCHA